MCITPIGREEESIAGRDSELSFGCDWLKNSSTCNIKVNQHTSITTTKTVRVSNMHHSHRKRRRIDSRERL